VRFLGLAVRVLAVKHDWFYSHSAGLSETCWWHLKIHPLITSNFLSPKRGTVQKPKSVSHSRQVTKEIFQFFCSKYLYRWVWLRWLIRQQILTQLNSYPDRLSGDIVALWSLALFTTSRRVVCSHFPERSFQSTSPVGLLLMVGEIALCLLRSVIRPWPWGHVCSICDMVGQPRASNFSSCERPWKVHHYLRWPWPEWPEPEPRLAGPLSPGRLSRMCTLVLAPAGRVWCEIVLLNFLWDVK